MKEDNQTIPTQPAHKTSAPTSALVRPAFGIGLAGFIAAGGRLSESDSENNRGNEGILHLPKSGNSSESLSKQPEDSNTHHYYYYNRRHRRECNKRSQAKAKNECGKRRAKEYTVEEVLAAINARQRSQGQEAPKRQKGRIKLESLFADDFNAVGECYFDVTPDKDNLRFEEPDPDDVPKGWKIPRGGIQCVGLPRGVCARSMLKQPESVELFAPHLDTVISKTGERYWRKQQKVDTFKNVKLWPDKALSERAEMCEEYIAVDRDWEQKKMSSRASDEAGSEAETTQSLLRKTAQFNEKLRIFPHEVDAWIEYANLQDEYMKRSNDRRCKKYVLDKKMAIYQAGLVKNPQSEKLFMAYLGVCRLVWDSGKIASLWNRVLESQGTPRAPQMTVDMWREYLHFSVEGLDTFSMNNVRHAYGKTIAMLSQSREKFPAISFAESESFIIEVFYELCCIEAKAGFCERAVAMMQAICEYNFFTPKECPSDRLKIEFARFWDSEAPRIGDEGSSGWNNWFCSNPALVEPPKKRKKRKVLPNEKEAERIVLTEESENFWGSVKAVEDAADEFLSELLGADDTEESSKEASDSGSGTESEDNEELEDDYNEDESGEDLEEANESEKKEGGERSSNSNSSSESENDDDTPRRALVLRNEDDESGDEETTRERVVEWARAELERESAGWKPMRASELEDGDDDTEGVVISDDISDLLFFVQLPENRVLLAYKFLELVGVSPPRLSATGSSSYRFKSTMVEAECADVFKLPFVGNKVSDLSTTWLCEGEWEGYFSHGFGVISLMQKEDSCIWGFCERLLSQFSELLPDVSQIVEAWMEYSAHRCSGNAAMWRGLAERLLGKKRTCLPLWHRYAQCEMVQGNAKKAAKVYKTAIGACSGNASKPGVLELAFAYTKMLLAQGGKENEIVDILTKAVGISISAGSGASATLTPTESVRVKKVYSDLIHDSACYPYAIGCLGVLTYVTHGIDEMRSVLEAAIVEAESDGSGVSQFQRERGMEVYVSLCWWHGTSPLVRPPPPPRDLRAVLFAAVFRYPENPYFISLLLATGVSLRLKSFLKFVVSESRRSAVLLSWLSARSIADNAFAVKLCEDMVAEGAAGRCCGALWEELALRYLRAGDRKAASGALLSMSRAAPWNKHVVLRCLANKDLMSLLSVHDIRGIIESFDDRGLRIRHHDKTLFF